jgi:hypothetical protein
MSDYLKVWIELPLPNSPEEAKDICAKANRMMQRLGNTDEREFSYWEKERMYSWGGHMGFMSLTDRGHWFNLDYLGRELKETEVSIDSNGYYMGDNLTPKQEQHNQDIDAQIQGEQYEH